MSFPQFALLHSVTRIQLRLLRVLRNCGCQFPSCALSHTLLLKLGNHAATQLWEDWHVAWFKGGSSGSLSSEKSVWKRGPVARQTTTWLELTCCLEVEFVSNSTSCVADFSICAAPFSNIKADNNSRKLQLRCGCQSFWCALGPTVLSPPTGNIHTMKEKGRHESWRSHSAEL
jgi:hypothetical protein